MSVFCLLCFNSYLCQIHLSYPYLKNLLPFTPLIILPCHTVNVLTIFTVLIMSLFCHTLFHWQVHFLIGENHNHLLLLPALLNSFSYDTCYQIPRLSDWLVSNVTHNRKYIIKLYFTIHYSSTFISLTSLFSIG